MKTPFPEASALDSYLDRHPDPTLAGGPAAVFRASPGEYLKRLGDRPIQCYQTERVLAAELIRLGYGPAAEPRPPARLAVVFATKHKEEVLYHLACAADLLDPGGTLLVSAANELGAASLEKRCAEVFGNVDSYSKHKCRVFRVRLDSARPDAAQRAAWRRRGDWQPMPGSGLWTRPGLFSWKAIDAGSRLLASRLPADPGRRGADLGAGYGYLARELLARAPGIAELHLFEAEKKALDAAERNLEGRTGNTALHYHWADVTLGLPLRGLDFVVMNPPFHAGRAAVPALGRAFVRVALEALRTGGRLFLVANRHLPYEAEIAAAGGRVEDQAEAEGFKVLAARREA